MKQEDEINRKVEKAFESIEEIQRAKLDPYFYTRLRTRMESNSTPSSVGWWSFALQPAMLLPLVIVLFLAEGIYVYQHLQGEDQSTLERSYFSSYYGLDSDQIYEIQ